MGARELFFSGVGGSGRRPLECTSLDIRAGARVPGIYGRLAAYIDSNTVLGLVLAQRR